MRSILSESRLGKNSPRILCAGGAVQDIVMRVEKFPDAGTKVQASEFLITSGGQAGNAAVAIARLGGQVNFAGPLGAQDDEFASRIFESLTRENVECSKVVRVPGAISSVSLILIDAVGEKTIATRRDHGLMSVVSEFPEQAVADVDAVLLDNRYPDFVTPICNAALARGIPRVLDFDRAASFDDPLLLSCSHVISSAEALRGTTGLNDLRAALKRLGEAFGGFLAYTDGSDGVYWLENGEIRHMEAFKVKAIDTLGAGDVFHGAFTFRLVETGDIRDAMRFAGAAAAIKCTRFGGLMGAATRAEVDEFLKRHSA
jgi:sugar/nucleoside kinase (ribokinase family)